MKVITLGKKGNQPFKITGVGVSSTHATITIDDYGQWYLADAGSTNGTFVRDEDTGDFVPVDLQGIPINEMTFIILGADNSAGCCFYARQILAPGDFMEEHFYMRNKKLEFDQEEEKVSKRAKWVRQIIFYSMALFTAGTFVWEFALKPSGESSSMMFMLYRGLSILTMGASTFYDAQGKRAKIIKKRKKFCQCPNPECDRKLTPDEIENLKCARCQK